MSDSTKDTGVIMALLERFEKQRLPAALALKEKVDRGELLSDQDISFLEQIDNDIKKGKPLIDRHPEFHDLVSRVVNLYKEISEKALENEKNT